MDPSNPLISTDSVDQWITDISINEVAISCMALHTNTNGLWRLARRMLGQLPTQATFAIVFWLPGHYAMLGLHVDQVDSFHVLLGNRGRIPPMIAEFLVIIQSLTEVPCPDKTPRNDPRNHTVNACAGYACALAQFFKRNINIFRSSPARTTLSPQNVIDIHTNAWAIYQLLISFDRIGERGEYNPNIIRNRHQVNTTTSNIVTQGNSKEDSIVID